MLKNQLKPISIKSFFMLSVVLFNIILVYSQYSTAEKGSLKESKIIIEYNHTINKSELLLLIQDNDALKDIKVINPDGDIVFTYAAKNGANKLGMSEVSLESAEASVQDVLLAFPEGIYTVQATTVMGKSLTGQSVLSHHLLPAPSFSPSKKALVDAANVIVTWEAVPGAKRYVIEIEQHELQTSFTAELPPTMTRLPMPLGLLVPNTTYKIEVGVISEEGNITEAESMFATMP